MIKKLWTNPEARFVLLFNGFGTIGTLLANRFLTEIVNPKDLGALYLYANVATWLILPATSCFVYSMHHWPMAMQSGATKKFTELLLRLTGVQIALILLCCLAMRSLHIQMISSTEIIIGIGLVALGQSLYQIFSPIPNSERRRITSGFLESSNSMGRPLLLALGCFVFGVSDSLSLLKFQFAHALIVGIAAILVFYPIYQSHKNTAKNSQNLIYLNMKSFLQFVLPALATSIAIQVGSTFERWGLAHQSGLADTGVFVQAIGLSTAAAAAITSLITGYYYPIITGTAARNEQQPLKAARLLVKKFLSLTVLAYLALAFFGFVGAGMMTHILFGKSYDQVATILPLTFLGSCFFGVGQALTIPLFVARDVITPNLGRVISLTTYVLLIVFFPASAGTSGIKHYALLFAATQMIYPVILGSRLFFFLRR